MKSRFAWALLCVAAASHADDALRDPTAWPPALRSAVAAAQAASGTAGSAGTAEAKPDPAQVRQVVFSGGRGYVVLRGRRHGVGELVDGARIERITEQAVWWREAGQLRRESLYGGVEKRPLGATAPTPKNSKELP